MFLRDSRSLRTALCAMATALAADTSGAALGASSAPPPAERHDVTAWDRYLCSMILNTPLRCHSSSGGREMLRFNPFDNCAVAITPRLAKRDTHRAVIATHDIRVNFGRPHGIPQF